MRVAIYTLGCKVNQYETQAMEQELLRRGHTLVPAETEADGYIVNTCSVTAVSDKKSRQMIRRCRKLNPDAVVAACGCYIQTHTDEAKGLGIDLIGGTGGRMAFLDLLEQVTREKQVTLLDDALRRREFEVLPAGGMAERTRAMLKVEDGCVNFCTYCIIPYARGPVRSLPKAEAVAQTRRLREEGYRELVITGIEISGWGHDLKNEETLIDLLEAVSAAAGDMRLRLGSLEPRTITEDFCRRAAALPQLCPQFHLSLQSGCTATLRRMRRVYTAQEYAQVVEQIRAAYGSRPVSFTTDCICGFPGETQADFEESCAFLKKIGFLKVHVFPYSRRSGTPAYDFPAQVHEREKQARSREMNALAEEVRREVLAAHVGTEDEVLLETPLSETLFTGYTRLYIPVVVSAPGHKSGEIVHVRLGEYDGERVRAALC